MRRFHVAYNNKRRSDFRQAAVSVRALVRMRAANRVPNVNVHEKKRRASVNGRQLSQRINSGEHLSMDVNCHNAKIAASRCHEKHMANLQ